MPAILPLIAYALISLASVIAGVALVQQLNIQMPIPNLALTWENIRNWIYTHVIEPIQKMVADTRATIFNELSRGYENIHQLAIQAETQAIVTTNQIAQARGMIENVVIPRVSTLEQWRYDAAAWLHGYLQPIAEGANALANTLKNWVNDYAVPTFSKITNSIAQVQATVTTTAKNLYDSIIAVQATLNNSIAQLRNETITRDNTLQASLNTAVSTINSQMQALDQKQTAAWKNLEQILSNTAKSLSDTIAKVRDETLAREADVARTIEDEINRDKLEPEDWLLLAFLGVTHRATIEGQGQMLSVLQRLFTSTKR